MSSSEKKPRPLQLKVEPEPVAEKPWKIRTQDGQVRGPFAIEQLRSLAEMDVLTPDAVIAPADGGNENWQPIAEHHIWAEVRTAFDRTKLKRADSGEPAPSDIGIGHLSTEITPAMQARLTEAKQRETHKLWRGVVLGRVAWVIRCVREVFIFFAFIAAGDLLTAFVPSALGIVRWGILMGVMAVALGYYVLKGIGK